MRSFLISLIVCLVSGCSAEPDCVTDAKGQELIKERKIGYSDLSKHVTCYDKNGKPY